MILWCLVSEMALYLCQSKVHTDPGGRFSALGSLVTHLYQFSTKLYNPRILPGLYPDLVLRMEIHKLSRPKVFNSDSSFSYTRLDKSLIRPCISTHMGWGWSLLLNLSMHFSCAQKQRGSKFWTESMYFQKQIQKNELHSNVLGF